MIMGSYLKKLIITKALKITNGRVKMFNKIDYIYAPGGSWAELWQKIGDDLGEEFLYKLGYEAGTDGAEEMIQNLNFTNKYFSKVKEVIMIMFETLGFGKLEFKIFKTSEGKALVHVTNHPVIDYAKKKFKDKSHVCAMYRSIFFIHGIKDLGLKKKYVSSETQCVCWGDKLCEWSAGIFSEEELKKSNRKVKIDQGD